MNLSSIAGAVLATMTDQKLQNACAVIDADRLADQEAGRPVRPEVIAAGQAATDAINARRRRS